MAETEQAPLPAETPLNGDQKLNQRIETPSDLLEQERADYQIVKCDPDRNLHNNAPLGSFMLAQRFNPDYFNWTPEEKKAIKERDIKRIGEIVGDRLVATGAKLVALYIINHDRDVLKTTKGDIYTVKEEHFHVIGRFKLIGKKIRENAAVSLTLPEIAQTLGVEPQFIEKPKSGRYSWDNFRAYLIHAKDPDKFQYKPSDVVTIYGTPYEEVYIEHELMWHRGIATKKKQDARISADWLLEQIDEDIYSRDEILLDDELRAIYNTNPDRFDRALRTHAEVKALHAIEALKKGEFEVSVFFLQGESNAGKSTFMDALIDACIKWSGEFFGKPWRYYDGATKNALDDYEGQEIVALDDIRGAAMEKEAWINLVNPKAAKRMSARYHNRRMAAHVLIITCPTDPVTFFKCARSNGTEADYDPIDQFLRRLQMLVQPIYIPALDPKHPMYAYLDPDNERDAQQLTKLLEAATQTQEPYALMKYERVPGKTPMKLPVNIADEYAPSYVESYYRPVRIGSRRYTLGEAVEYALNIVKQNNTKGVEVETVEDSEIEDAAVVAVDDYEIPQQQQTAVPQQVQTEEAAENAERENLRIKINQEWEAYFDARADYMWRRDSAMREPVPPMYRDVDEYLALQEQTDAYKVMHEAQDAAAASLLAEPDEF